MPRLESQAKAGYYPTPDRAAAEIANRIYTMAKTEHATHFVCRVLDPCCGTGSALIEITRPLHRHRGPVMTYGIEVNAGRAELASQTLDRVLSADLFATSIANEAFSLLYLNPPYDDETSGGDQKKKRTELAFLQKCTPYLTPGNGILVFVIPKRILRNCAKYLATNYHDIHCFNFPEDEREQFKQIFLMGQRKTIAYQDSQIEEEIHRWALDPPDMDDDENRGVRYMATVVEKGDILFNNLFFDPQNIVQEARKAGLCTNRTFQNILNPPDEDRKLPLLPLRQGHVAMLTAAGFLDNMELGEPGSKVLVKGRTYKESLLVESTEEKEVHREVMKYEILMLDLQTGEFQEIRD